MTIFFPVYRWKQLNWVQQVPDLRFSAEENVSEEPEPPNKAA